VAYNTSNNITEPAIPPLNTIINGNLMKTNQLQEKFPYLEEKLLL